MKMTLILALLALSLGGLAQTSSLESIHALKEDMGFEEVLVFLDSGKVLKAHRWDAQVLGSLYEAHSQGLAVNISHNADRFIEKVEEGESLEKTLELDRDYSQTSLAPNYTPTVLNNFQEAKNIFMKLRGRPKRSAQCYHKAHVWAWEAFKKHNLYSLKAFMFFTTKYIREYNYQWWFHVAPMTYVKENGVTNEYILDWQYLNVPARIPNWSKIFVKNKPCVEISKYSQYLNNQEKEYCFISKYLMYYYQPKDLEAYERYNAAKTFWFDWEIEEAYELGFGVSKP